MGAGEAAVRHPSEAAAKQSRWKACPVRALSLFLLHCPHETGKTTEIRVIDEPLNLARLSAVANLPIEAEKRAGRGGYLLGGVLILESDGKGEQSKMAKL